MWLWRLPQLLFGDVSLWQMSKKRPRQGDCCFMGVLKNEALQKIEKPLIVSRKANVFSVLFTVVVSLLFQGTVWRRHIGSELWALHRPRGLFHYAKCGWSRTWSDTQVQASPEVQQIQSKNRWHRIAPHSRNGACLLKLKNLQHSRKILSLWKYQYSHAYSELITQAARLYYYYDTYNYYWFSAEKKTKSILKLCCLCRKPVQLLEFCCFHITITVWAKV